MKTLVRLTFATLLLTLCGSAASAQKFGYVNLNEVASLMPESDSATVKLQALQKELIDQLDAVQVELNKKGEEYRNNQATYSEAINQMKVKELTDLQARYQDLQEIANQQYQKTQGDLLNPIYEKAQKAVEKAGKDNGFTLVFNNAALVYYNSASVVDMMPLIKKELNLKEKPATPAAAAPAAGK